MEPFKLIKEYDCGDCTSCYSAEINEGFTIGDLIDYCLADKSSWGYIYIDDKKRFEYRRGSVVSDSLSDEEKNTVVYRMTANGGWGSMDYNVLIREREPNYDYIKAIQRKQREEFYKFMER